MIKVISGPRGSGKTHKMLEYVRQNLKRGDTIVMVSSAPEIVNWIAKQLVEDRINVRGCSHPTVEAMWKSNSFKEVTRYHELTVIDGPDVSDEDLDKLIKYFESIGKDAVITQLT